MGLWDGIKRALFIVGILAGLGFVALLAIPDGNMRPVVVATATEPTAERAMIDRLRQMAHPPATVDSRAVAAAPLKVARPAAAPAQETVTADAVRRRVNASALNLREGPSSSTPVRASLTQGMEVEVAETHNNWVRVIGPDGQSGWVFAKYLG